MQNKLECFQDERPIFVGKGHRLHLQRDTNNFHKLKYQTKVIIFGTQNKLERFRLERLFFAGKVWKQPYRDCQFS